MKKAILSLSLVIAVLIHSCGSGSPSVRKELPGTWTLTSIDFGAPTPPENQAQMNNLIEIMKQSIKFAFTSEGKLTTENPDLFSGADGSAILQRGTWTLNQEENRLHTSMENPNGGRTESDYRLSITDGQLILKKSDNPRQPEILTTMIFSKRK